MEECERTLRQVHDRLTMVEESQRSTERDVELMREMTQAWEAVNA